MAKAFTPADRIRDLSDISEETSKMLTSAALAVNCLTGRPAPAVSDKATMTAGTAETFETHARDYYTKLQAILARLRRQAIALEEAGIISAESVTLSNSNNKNDQSAGITNGGLGNLDIGWLNSRGNKIATEKEQELLTDMKVLLQEMLARRDEEMAMD